MHCVTTLNPLPQKNFNIFCKSRPEKCIFASKSRPEKCMSFAKVAPKNVNTFIFNSLKISY